MYSKPNHCRPFLHFALPLCLAPIAFGQGTVIIDRPVPQPVPPGPARGTPLELKYQNVYTEIADGVAVTTVKQTFQNPLRTQIEGTYVYPLPEGVAVGDFNMTVGGKTLHGEVLDKDAARRTYEEIVRRTRDPGLLEYLNSRLYQAQIFPIPPRGQLDVELKYSQTLVESDGLGTFQHPLRIQSNGGRSIERLVVSVKVHSTLPLTTVFCPTHPCDVSRPNDHDATLVYEAANVVPDRDFQMYYQRKDTEYGLSLLTHREAGEEGYFLIRISPRIELDDDAVLPKDIAFVIDTSGSMSGGKLDQVKKALSFCIGSLSPRDRFNIFAFSTDVRPFRESLVSAESDVKQAAVKFTEEMRPLGGTNINQALLAALAARTPETDRPYLVVFMTDGEPTVDVTNPAEILRNVTEKNPTGDALVRFHVLGVGTQVNTHLLDKLAEATRGVRDYCTEREDLELKLSGFVSRLANPVLADLKLHLEGFGASDVYPKDLADLFRGTDLVVLGRYDGSGHHAIRLDGRSDEGTHTLTYEGDFPRLSLANEFLPRLWANRKVGYLLDQIRLHGSNRELVDEVVRLAKRHGIVTPYTSALILEDEAQVAVGTNLHRAPSIRDRSIAEAHREAAERRADLGERGIVGRAALQAPSGDDAVDASKAFQRLQGQEHLDSDLRLIGGSVGPRSSPPPLRHVADKTFVYDGQRWLDTVWDEKVESKKITAFSEQYFQLLRDMPEIAKFLALGERVVVAMGDSVYETLPAEQP